MDDMDANTSMLWGIDNDAKDRYERRDRIHKELQDEAEQVSNVKPETSKETRERLESELRELSAKSKEASKRRDAQRSSNMWHFRHQHP